MAVDAFVQLWSGVGYRHIPAGSPYGVLDFRFAGLSTENRWNVAGEPTVYLAGDAGVALTEFGRHFDLGRAPALRSEAVERALFQIEVQLDAVLDLTDLSLCDELGLRDAPTCFLDRPLCRSVASFLRVASSAQAIRVPSVAFLDNIPARWSMVLFIEKLPLAALDNPRLVRTFRVGPGP